MRCRAAIVCLLALGCGEVQRTAAGGEPTDLGTRRAGTDWPRFLGPTGDSVSSETGIISPWPKEGPRLVWEMKLGVGYGMPSISRGRLYLFDRHGDKARLSCFKSETADFLWKFEYPTDYEDYYGYNNGPRCCPVVDDDRVYVYGAEGMLHCVSAMDGKPIWKVDTKKEFGVEQNFFGVGAAPVVEGDLLIAQVGGMDKKALEERVLQPKGNGSAVVAFDKRTGQVRYKVSDELASYASPVLTTIGERRWCFVFARGGLLGLDPATGQLDFHYPWRARVLESVNASNPVVVGDRVFITECYGPGSSLLKVRPGGYEVVWEDASKGRRKSMQAHWNTPIHHDGYLYGCSGRHLQEAELRCVELATGKVMWSEPGLTRTSLLMADGHFLCLSEVGELRLLKVNPRKYDEVAHLVLRDPARGAADGEAGQLLQYPCWAAPVLSHGLLYVRGKDRLACLELIPGPRKD